MINPFALRRELAACDWSIVAEKQQSSFLFPMFETVINDRFPYDNQKGKPSASQIQSPCSPASQEREDISYKNSSTKTKKISNSA